MKKIKIKYIALILLITVFSCEDYLLTDSPSQFTANSLFTNVDFAKKAVSSIYATLMSDNGYGFYMLYYMFDSDIEYNISANNSGFNSISHFDHSAGNPYNTYIWNNCYQGIEMANICIDKLPQSPIWMGNNAKIAQNFYGQAVTLRALCYYWLISIFGDVPFVEKPAKGEDDFYIPKTDRDSIYEFLIQDLKDVEDYVPWISETGTAEVVNKSFVKGLRARLALAYAGYSLRNKTFETKRGRYWQEYYQIANQECKDLMESGEHQLNPSYENMFRMINSSKQDITYHESFAELAFGRGLSGRLGFTVGMLFASYDPQYGYSGPASFTSPLYYYSFDKADLRRNVNVELYNYSGTGANLGKQVLNPLFYYRLDICKWRKSYINPPMGGAESKTAVTGINWPMMRYADVILMFAESENELNGPSDAAKEALSAIRKRAFPEKVWPQKVTQYVDSVASSKASFFNAIVDERMWELGGEFLRKYDLTRWNLLGPKFRELKENMQKIVNDDPKYANVPTYLFWKRNDDGERIDILNPDYRLTNTAITGYTRSAWLPKISSSQKTTMERIIGYVANGYNESLNNHLYPIGNSIIESSKGVLSNDQMPGPGW